MGLLEFAELYLQRVEENKRLQEKEEIVLGELEHRIKEFLAEQKETKFEIKEQYGETAMAVVRYLVEKRHLALPKYTSLLRYAPIEGDIVLGLPGRIKVEGKRGKVDERNDNGTYKVRWEDEQLKNVPQKQLKKLAEVKDYFEFLKELVGEVERAPIIDKAPRRKLEIGDRVMVNTSIREGHCGKINRKRNVEAAGYYDLWGGYVTKYLTVYEVSFRGYKAEFKRYELSPLTEASRSSQEAQELVQEAVRRAERKYPLPENPEKGIKQFLAPYLRKLKSCGWEEDRIRTYLTEKNLFGGKIVCA